MNQPAQTDFAAYAGTACLVTGGLGFIGSNLARRLVELGAVVTVVDNRFPGQGANSFNLDGVSGVSIREHDIGDADAIAAAVRGQDYIFNLAGKSSHVDVLESPFADMETNVRAQLVLLEAIRREASDARVVYASTRSVYGAIQTRPVSEDHPFLPTESNSVDKAAADLYHIAYSHSHGLSTICLRLTNVYGPRMLMSHSRQGFINWFVRLAVEGKAIRLFGDGLQQRDLIYVDDAVDAFLVAGLTRQHTGTALNIGSGVGVSLREIAERLIAIGGRGQLVYAPFPESMQKIEIGDYVTDTRKTQRLLHWQARTSLECGLKQTCEFYEAHLDRYL